VMVIIMVTTTMMTITTTTTDKRIADPKSGLSENCFELTLSLARGSGKNCHEKSRAGRFLHAGCLKLVYVDSGHAVSSNGRAT
jgi:hypothetical protein